MNRFVMAAAIIENSLYFSDRYSNGLYQLDLNNGECTFIDYFYEERPEMQLYFQAYVWKKKIYFIPGLAENIACFDTVTKEITYIKLPAEGIVIHGIDGLYAEKFRCQKHEEMLWMMPVGYNLFLKFNMSNGQLRKIDLPDSLELVEGIFNWRTSFLYGEEIIFQPWAGTVRVHYNIVSECIKLEEVKEKIRIYLNYFKEEPYEIYVPWKLENGILVKNILDSKKQSFLFENRVKDQTCVVAFLIKKQLYLIPEHGRILIVIPISNFSINYLDLNDKFGKNYISWECVDMIENRGKYFIFSSVISEILVIDLNSENINLIETNQEDYISKKNRFKKCITNINRKSFQVVQKKVLDEERDGLEQLIVQSNLHSIDRRSEYFYYGNKIFEKLKDDSI